MKKSSILIVFLIAFNGLAQRDATYKEFQKEYVTYAFSDPNPIPAHKKIYPYFRFDGFTDKTVTKKWKVVQLQNDYITVQIMPEIGGKVWAATDKKTNKDFLYNNGVVKFRDIALRGPWVSGGIEANYGIIGHTPNSATPVDYLVRNNPDGSVSCFTSTLDLLTRTRWVLEIKLEKDRAYFTTSSYWFNSNPVEKSYYTWMNSAIPAAKDLEFLYPGNHYIGHDGSMHHWPLDSLGRNLSHYSQNDFGGSKSYHVFGVHSNYFGGYWKNDDFGMIHYANRDDKLGKKIFLWAQSEQGRIWEDLLTDNSGQYVEMQSGRLFNQNMFESSFTPFKQVGFDPYSNDRWTEYWFPFEGIDGFTSANPIGAFNIESKPNNISVKISPVQPIQDSLRVYTEEGEQLASIFVKVRPMESFMEKINIVPDMAAAYLKLKGYRINLSNDKIKKNLSRPIKTPKSFDSESAYGLYLQGRDLYNFRNYKLSEEKIKASLLKAPLFIPSLVEMAKLKLFRMQPDSAFYYSKKALSIDTYHSEANYYYGLAASKIGDYDDALDGFEVAALSSNYRNAAYTELSKLYLKHLDFKNTMEYAKLALQNKPANMEALKITYVLARIKNDTELIKTTKKKILTLNPLSHFMGFETFYKDQIEENKKDFTTSVRNELPIETYLELAIWYADLNRMDESRKVLETGEKNAVSLYWLAWLYRNGNPKQSEKYLKEAEKSSVNFVFPFRQESAKVLKWASEQNHSWKPAYLLTLIEDFRGNEQQGLSLLNKHDNVDFAPFYIEKARLDTMATSQERLKYIQEAVVLQPKEWRYGQLLAKVFLELNDANNASKTLEKYYKADKTNYIIGLDLVQAFMQANMYKKAEKIISTLHVLPFEGANDAREYYRETKLMLAYNAMEKRNFDLALKKIEEAEKWPEHLGVGKPYPELIDNTIENEMKALIYKRMGKADLYQKQVKELKNKTFDGKKIKDQIKSISKTDKKLF